MSHTRIHAAPVADPDFIGLRNGACRDSSCMNVICRSSLVGAQRSSESRNAISGAFASSTPRFRAAAGPLCSMRSIRIALSRPRQMFASSISRAVIDNDQLKRGDRLREHRIDRLEHHRAPIVGRDDYARLRESSRFRSFHVVGPIDGEDSAAQVVDSLAGSCRAENWRHAHRVETFERGGALRAA